MVDEDSGKIFPRPETFREVAPALALAREVAEKHMFLCDFRTSGFKGLIERTRCSYYFIILLHSLRGTASERVRSNYFFPVLPTRGSRTC